MTVSIIIKTLNEEGRIGRTIETALATLSPLGGEVIDGKVHPPIQKGNGPVDLQLSNDLPSGPTTFSFWKSTKPPSFHEHEANHRDDQEQ